MEHEVFVPVPAEPLRHALGDPARVVRSVPGLQRDAAEEDTFSGRLKVRVGGHTITYRGAVGISPAAADGTGCAVEGEGTEARGAGGVKFTLDVRVVQVDGGSLLVFSGTGSGDGRLAEVPSSDVESAVRRLLNRFAEMLSASVAGPAGPGDAVAAAEAEEAVASAEEVIAEADVSDLPVGRIDPVAQDPALGPELYDPGTYDPEALDAVEDAIEDAIAAEEIAEGIAEISEADEVAAVVFESFTEDGFDEVPPAEAAHARRTMIGRSAEEVDHAPPRGRYTPVAAPASGSAADALRWVGPVAVAVVASAVVAGRILRRRR